MEIDIKQKMVSGKRRESMVVRNRFDIFFSPRCISHRIQKVPNRQKGIFECSISSDFSVVIGIYDMWRETIDDCARAIYTVLTDNDRHERLLDGIGVGIRFGWRYSRRTAVSICLLHNRRLCLCGSQSTNTHAISIQMQCVHFVSTLALSHGWSAHTHTCISQFCVGPFGVDVCVRVHRAFESGVFCVRTATQHDTHTIHTYIMFMRHVWETFDDSSRMPAIHATSASWAFQLENCREFVWVRIATLSLSLYLCVYFDL